MSIDRDQKRRTILPGEDRKEKERQDPLKK